jgi:hypothetical protein
MLVFSFYSALNFFNWKWFFIQGNGDITLKEEDVVVCNVKIDLTRGRSNPLEK